MQFSKTHQHIQQYATPIITTYIPVITLISTIYSVYWNYLNCYFLSFNYIHYMSTKDFIYDVVDFLPITIIYILLIYIYVAIVDTWWPLKISSMRYSSAEDLIQDHSYRWRFLFLMLPAISALLIFGFLFSDVFIQSRSNRAMFVVLLFIIYIALILYFVHSTHLNKIIFFRYKNLILIRKSNAFMTSSFIFSLSFICLHAYVSSIFLVNSNGQRLNQIIHYKSDPSINDVTVKILDIGVVVYRKSSNIIYLQKWENVDYISASSNPIVSIQNNSLGDFIETYIQYFGIPKYDSHRP